MKRILVTYLSEIITSSGPIDGRGCHGISFENVGTDDAMIDKVIPVTVGDAPRVFSNQGAEEAIIHKFNISFAGVDPDKQILVIRTYKKIETA